MFNQSLFVLTLMTLSGTVLSAPLIVNLRVNGSISPPACTLNGQTESTYTYIFDISPDLFPASGNLTLSPQTQNIEVVCDAATYLTFTAADGRAGTEFVTGNNAYGLGIYDTNTKIGYYLVRITNATVKTSVEASATKVSILSGTAYSASTAMNKVNVLGWATSAGQLTAGQIFAADFTVSPFINNALKNSAGDAELDGFAILAFSFSL